MTIMNMSTTEILIHVFMIKNYCGVLVSEKH